jgi:hypothetical protein
MIFENFEQYVTDELVFGYSETQAGPHIAAFFDNLAGHLVKLPNEISPRGHEGLLSAFRPCDLPAIERWLFHFERVWEHRCRSPTYRFRSANRGGSATAFSPESEAKTDAMVPSALGARLGVTASTRCSTALLTDPVTVAVA